jgi:hypothetical protein
MAQIVGQDPRPRALLLGIDPASVAPIAACFPISAEIAFDRDVVMSEWDVVVCEAEVPDWLAEHLYVISFGRAFRVPPADMTDFKLTGPRQLGRWMTSPAREFVIPEGLPMPVAEIVRKDLAPAAHSASRNDGGNSVIVEGQSGNRYLGRTPKAVRPFLHTLAGGLALAGSWERKGGAEIWSLPSRANRPSWINAALEVWSDRNGRTGRNGRRLKRAHSTRATLN